MLAGSRASLRLVRELDRTGRIPPEALERAFEALRDFRSIALGSGVRRIVAAGTSALRDAANGPPFIRRVKRELGITIRILSGSRRRATASWVRWAACRSITACSSTWAAAACRWAASAAGGCSGAVSVPLGALRVSDAFLKSDPPAPREMRRLREHARDDAATRRGSSRSRPDEQLVGTGGRCGTWPRWTSAPPATRSRGCTGTCCTARRLHEIDGGLAGREAEEARARAGPERRPPRLGGRRRHRDRDADGGARRAPGVVVSGQGVREGLALSIGARHARAGREREAPLARGARVALRGLVEGARPSGARRSPARCYEALEPGPASEVAEALLQAARILDIGRTVDFFDRHEHVADLVLATDLGGFSHRQVALLAATVRQAGDEDERARARSRRS